MTFTAWLEDQLSDIPERADGEGARSRWVGLCLCGHGEDYHGAITGAVRPEGREDEEILGCRGATPNRGSAGARWDGGRRMWIYDATCPCTRYRHVADVDRPGRLFRQKVWTKDDVHPMARGLRAMRTRLTNMKSVGGRGKDPEEEMERRFRKVEGAWVCRICKAGARAADGADGESVRPVYVSEGRHSQMRCKNHTREKAPSLYGAQQDSFSYEWKTQRGSGNGPD